MSAYSLGTESQSSISSDEEAETAIIRGKGNVSEGEPTLSVEHAAATGAAVLLSGVASFHIALGLGAPFGDHVYGGRTASHGGKLPAPLRVGSGFSAALLAVFAWVLLARSGMVDARGISTRTLASSVWVLVVLMSVNTLGNLASKSPLEKWGFGSTSALIAVLCALSTPAKHRRRR